MSLSKSQEAKLKEIRLHKVFERYLSEGGTRKHVGHTRARHEPVDDGILTVYQLRDIKGEIKLREGYVEIVSTTLREFLRKAFEEYPEPELNTSPMRFHYPYFPFIHLHEKLEELISTFKGEPEEIKHLQYLRKFITEELRDDVKEFDQLKDFSNEVSFKQLWTCFIPGQIVVKKDEIHCEECFQIKGVKYTPEVGDNPEHTFFLVSGTLAMIPSLSILPVDTDILYSPAGSVYQRPDRLWTRDRSSDTVLSGYQTCCFSRLDSTQISDRLAKLSGYENQGRT